MSPCTFDLETTSSWLIVRVCRKCVVVISLSSAETASDY